MQFSKLFTITVGILLLTFTIGFLTIPYILGGHPGESNIGLAEQPAATMTQRAMS